ncbi:transposase, partial [Corynebacterium sp. HMSC14B06]
MEPSTTPDIIIGLDVGKTDHHACALTNTGERIYDKPLPQDEAARREIFASMQAH